MGEISPIDQEWRYAKAWYLMRQGNAKSMMDSFKYPAVAYGGKIYVGFS